MAHDPFAHDPARPAVNPGSAGAPAPYQPPATTPYPPQAHPHLTEAAPLNVGSANPVSHNGRDAPPYADQGYGAFEAPGALPADRYAAIAEDSADTYYDAEAHRVGDNWLTIRGVRKSYKTKHVVKGVSLSVGRGEAVGLLGPNGAGKTTVFYMITGLIPPDQGHVLIDGQDATAFPMYRRARLGIGYLPQEQSIFRGLTLEENILAVLQLHEKDRRKRQMKLDSLLEEFSLTDRRKQPSIALSGGERRRCEIARALASDPNYVLLDEPFAGVDPLAVGEIQGLVQHLKERGIGVLITDHNVRETLSLIDRAYIIVEGKVLMEGSPDEVKRNEDVRRAYLGNMFSE